MMAKKYFLLITALALPFFARGVGAEVSSGTAFAVAPGLLITNHHVVARCSSVDVVTTDGRRGGSVLDADAQIDLALLRVSGIPSATARLRSPRNIRLGESVTVFGFPLTGSLSSGGNFTTGVVSALRGFRDAPGALQITAPVQSGNSGGPLMDASGLVIGVVQAKLDALRSAVVTGDIPQNVNFAISLQVLADFLAKNRVEFRDSALSAPLDTARVAQLAQSFTYRVECRGRSQQARFPPNTKQDRLPPTKSESTRSRSEAGFPPSTKQDRLPTKSESELTRSRSDVIQKIKETRAGVEKLLALHETERQRLLEEYHRRRELYNQGLMTREDVLQAERALAEAMIRVDEDKRWLTESDSVVSEFMQRDESLRSGKTSP
jgi:hypothetical protein